MDYIGFNGSAISFNLLADVRFKDSDGSHYVGFQAPSTVGTNLVWTLPASDGSASHVLKTAGDGTLSFGEIVNASVASNAAIAGTKIDPDFGSQAMSTTGSLGCGDITISDITPAINFTDSDGSQNYQIRLNGGILKFTDTTNSAERIQINADGHVDVLGNLDVGSGLDVTGNITVTGTVDGVDIATRDTLFGGLTASSGVLTDGVSATTQTASDNTTKVATTAYVTTAVNNLINGAPAALDTLNELAAAMNDDAAFSTTVTNSLATKLALAGGQMTGNITFSGSQTVDGRDLSVDGAKLDGGIMLADGDKGDITVSNSGATFTIDSGAIDNANIASNAAIAGTKISPDFGSQDITTTGHLDLPDDSKIKVGTGNDLEIFHSNDISRIRNTNDSGTLKIQATSNGENAINIVPNGTVELYHDGTKKFETTSGGVSVAGNIVVSGTVDGVDIATRDTLFGGLTASSGVLTNGVTATTQSASDSTTKVATTAFTQSAISNATITGAQLSANAIDTTKIADNAVTSAKIANGTITGSDIDDNTITATNIGNGAVNTDELQDSAVTSAKILDGTIVNADINASAAIAGTKISPDFGSQAVSTTGALGCGDITIGDVSPAINFTDSDENPDYQIRLNGGILKFTDTTNSADRLQINTDGHIDVTGNLDVGAGLDVTGDTTVTGNMGVGTTSPVAKVHIAGSNYASVGGGFDSGVVLALTRNNTVSQTAGLALNSGTSGASFIHFGDADDADLGEIKYLHSDNSMSLILSGTNRLKINSSGLELTGNTTIAGSITATGASSTLELNGGIISLKNQGAQSEVRLYCESSNAHYAAVQAPAHSVFSGNVTLTLPAAAGSQSLVGTTETQTLTNKTLTSAVLNTGVSGSAILDEDNMASNSNTQLATQQSIKAYVDATAGGGGGSPGGSNTQVQFNNSGSFGGSSNLTFDGTNLTVGGTVSGTSSASGTAGFRKITASTSAPTSSDGADGDVWIKYTA